MIKSPSFPIIPTTLQKKVGGLASNLILLLLLFGATCFAATSWYKADIAQRAPIIEGFDWIQHPNALLIVYPVKSCSCGSGPRERVLEGLLHGLDVVVMAPALSKELEALRVQAAKGNDFPKQRFLLRTDADSSLVQRFSPDDKVTSVRIKNGRIIQYTSDSMLPQTYFQ